MKRKMEVSELVFKIIAYIILIIFALMCVYPLIYVLSAAFSGVNPVEHGDIVLWPLEVQGEAFLQVFKNNMFWVSYANTLFVTFFGTIWALGYSILGAYALSKKRLMGRRGWNFFLVFTMWFSAGIIPQYTNYINTYNVFQAVGVVDFKWLIVISMGMNATNIILLRNSFEGVPAEIEEAARIDGATEMQVLTKVYIPMSKSTIATVALFFGISRWNGYFWARRVSEGYQQDYSWPIQVYIRTYLENMTYIVSAPSPEGIEEIDKLRADGAVYSTSSVAYAMIVCAIVPILCIYPFIQKYFAKGVNMGGVKE